VLEKKRTRENREKDYGYASIFSGGRSVQEAGEVLVEFASLGMGVGGEADNREPLRTEFY